MRVGKNTVVGHVWHESHGESGGGKGYDHTVYKRLQGAQDKDSRRDYEKLIQETRAMAWMAVEKGVPTVPLNYFHQDLPDGVNTDYRKAGIHTLYNTGQDTGTEFAKKIAMLVEKNAERTSGFSRMLKREVNFYVDSINQDTARNMVKEIVAGGIYESQLVDEYTILFIDKRRPMSQPLKIHFLKGEW